MSLIGVIDFAAASRLTMHRYPPTENLADSNALDCDGESGFPIAGTICRRRAQLAA
jgi:hypothetical protein